MPRIAKELSALEVRRLVHPTGKGGPVNVAVGGVAGLMLQLSPHGGRSWLLRVAVGGKRRELGLGSFPEIALAKAWEKAREAKEQINKGIDPVEEKKAVRSQLAAKLRRGLTFADAVDKFCVINSAKLENARYEKYWKQSVTTNALPILGKQLVQDITSRDILMVLEPIWQTKNATARGVRMRIEEVLSWATVAGHREGENPARWAGNLKILLPTVAKAAEVTHQPALQIADVSAWFSAVSARSDMSSRALEFIALTVARSGEVRGATWDEVDLKNGTWTIPASRMKMKSEHRVALSNKALALLEAMPRLQGNDLIFTAVRGGPLSDKSVSETMKDIHETAGPFVDRVSKRPAVPHGLRSSFRQWAAECGFDRDLAEMALAHKVGSEVERAYQRSDMLERRRELMQAWADHMCSEPV